MNPRILSYRAASNARRPIRLDLVDMNGEEFVVELPGDVPADPMLAFFEAYGKRLTEDFMPTDVILPYMQMVFGGRLDDLRKRLTFSDLQKIARMVWDEMLVTDEGSDDDPLPPTT